MENILDELSFLDEIVAFGHTNILGTHQTTLEVTTENFLTKRGSCIIGINADKSIFMLNNKTKRAIQNEKQIFIELNAGPHSDMFWGLGNKDLTLDNKISIVFRKSGFISDRTGLILCSKASADLDREMMIYLQNPEHQINIRFYQRIEEI